MSDDKDKPFTGDATAMGDDLDLLVSMDEPESLMRALEAAARRRTKRKELWAIVATSAAECLEELAAANQPKEKEAD